MNEAGEQILLHRIKSLEWLIDVKTEHVHKLETALMRIRDCDFEYTGNWGEGMRAIAREALE
jgi:hypothetical protein